MAALRLDLHWASETARHTDSLFARKLNLWRDIFPPELEQKVMGQPVGHRASHAFAPGELVPSPQEQRLLRLRNDQFDRRFTGRGQVQPRAGRFYPKGMLEGVAGVFRADRQPFRVAEVTGESLLADLNHPLADRPLRLDCTIEEIWAQGDERGGRCSEVADLVTAGGPGHAGPLARPADRLLVRRPLPPSGPSPGRRLLHGAKAGGPFGQYRHRGGLGPLCPHGPGRVPRPGPHGELALPPPTWAGTRKGRRARA